MFRRLSSRPPRLLQCSHLGHEHGIAIDQPSCSRDRHAAGTLDFIDRDVERISIASAARIIWACLLRHDRRSSVKRIDHQHAGTKFLGRPLCKTTKIRQVTDALTAARVQCV